jgi:hypothetical protein
VIAHNVIARVRRYFLFLVGALLLGFALAFYIELKDFWEPLGSFQKLSSSALSVLGMILVNEPFCVSPSDRPHAFRSHAGRD